MVAFHRFLERGCHTGGTRTSDPRCDATSRLEAPCERMSEHEPVHARFVMGQGIHGWKSKHEMAGRSVTRRGLQRVASTAGVAQRRHRRRTRDAAEATHRTAHGHTGCYIPGKAPETLARACRNAHRDIPRHELSRRGRALDRRAYALSAQGNTTARPVRAGAGALRFSGDRARQAWHARPCDRASSSETSIPLPEVS